MSETSAAAGTTAGEPPADTTQEGAESAAQPRYFRIENDFVDCCAERIGAIPFAVRVVLGRFVDNKTRRCYPSSRKIARILNLSQQTVLKAIAVLEKEGLLKVERRRTKGGERLVNVYTLLPAEGAQAASAPVLNDVEHRAKGAIAEQDLINKTQENKLGEPVPVRAAAARKPRPRDPNLDHPAIKSYAATFGVTPTETQRAEIVRVVADVSTWGQVLRDWQLANYSERNIPGMLDRYRKEMRSRSGRNGHGFGKGAHAVGRQFGFGGDTLHEHRECGSPETSEDTAQRDAEWRAIVSEYGTRSSDCDS